MNVSSFSAWVPLMAWVHTKRKEKHIRLNVSPALLNWVAGYFLLSALTDTAMFTMAELGIHNLWLVHVYEVPSFFVALKIYHSMLPKVAVRWFWIAAGAFVSFQIADLWLFYPALAPTAVAKGVILAIFGIIYLFLLPSQAYPAERTLGFWVNYGFLLYFLGSIVLFGVLDVISFNQSQVYVWGIHALLNTIKGLLVTVGLLLIPPTMRVS